MNDMIFQFYRLLHYNLAFDTMKSKLGDQYTKPCSTASIPRQSSEDEKDFYYIIQLLVLKYLVNSTKILLAFETLSKRSNQMYDYDEDMITLF